MDGNETQDLTELSDILQREHGGGNTHVDTVYSVLRKVIPRKLDMVSDPDLSQNPLTRVFAAMRIDELGRMHGNSTYFFQFAAEVALGRWLGGDPAKVEEDKALGRYIEKRARGEIAAEPFYKRLATGVKVGAFVDVPGWSTKKR